MMKSSRRRFVGNLAAAGVVAATPSFAASRWSFPGETAAVKLDPIPANEQALPQIQAEPWLQLDTRNVFLKGMAFDRQNNLTVIAAYPGAEDKGLAGRLDRAILRITPEKQVSTLFKQHGVRMCDHVIHKDGRIFVACLTGELLCVQPDGSSFTQVQARWQGKPTELSDLTFDRQGALYVTDFTGKPGDPSGGIYRYDPDLTTVHPFGPKLVSPNGIAFTAEERAQWVSLSFDRKLVQLKLSADRRSVEGIGATYGLNGQGGDGLRVDRKGNVYLALNFQGRFLIFNAHGVPVATVLLPGREQGALLSSTNLVFRPGTSELYAVGSGDVGGTWIYRFPGLAEGLPLFSHQQIR